MIRFDGRVALITGAGSGLGRAYALALARRGATVVVNDLPEGSGRGSAQEVVDAVVGGGGIATAAYASVAEPDQVRAMVDKCVTDFGRIDIVINNAGLIRDRTFAKMTLEDMKLMLDVHLLGSMLVTHAAWPHMIERRYGRVIMTTSSAGLFGNFGQANYAAAKMGLVGLTKTLALEGQPKAIMVNAVAPIAITGMGSDAFPHEWRSRIPVEAVVPLVEYLCSAECTTTGCTFQAGAGRFARVETLLGQGISSLETEPTAEWIRSELEALLAVDGAPMPSAGDAVASFL